MSSIAVIGAGITGLTAAFELRKRGLPVRLFEAGSEPGGVIRSIRRDGYLAECGPNTLLDTSPKIPELIRAGGLEPLYSFPEAKAKYVVRGGRLIELPSTQLEFLTTPVFSWGAKLRLIREPFIARGAADQEESLGAFVLRRLGQEFLDYAINPFVAGVYAGDPHKLSVREAFGKVYDLEQKYGSLIKGQFLGARERKKRGTVSKDKAAKISFPEGLQSLPRALAKSLGGAVEYGVQLQSIESIHERWKLRFEGGREETFDSVLLAIPAYKLAEIESSGHRLFSFLSAIRYAPISSVVLGFKREQVAHSLDGFGFLVPEVEGLNILGAIFNSSLFPNRAPAGHVTITVYLGGFRNPSLPFLTADEQLKLVLTDLTKTLGVTGEPTFFHQVTHAKAIPQYEIGYANIRKQIEQVELENPGLYLGGNYRGGVSLSDSILNGLNFADRIAARLGDGKIVPEMAKSPTLG
jgi:oxygen-dependent protoporphyrinogen oxidase